jgi:hypothetical protein
VTKPREHLYILFNPNPASAPAMIIKQTCQTITFHSGIIAETIERSTLPARWANHPALVQRRRQDEIAATAGEQPQRRGRFEKQVV